MLACKGMSLDRVVLLVCLSDTPFLSISSGQKGCTTQQRMECCPSHLQLCAHSLRQEGSSLL